MVTREDILAIRTTLDICNHFLKEYYDKEGYAVKPGVHIYVPEISGEQKTPSFNIYFSSKSNEYRYKDFTGNDGSAFDLVMNLYNVSFPDALRIIDKEMNLGLFDSVNNVVSKVKPKRKKEIHIEDKRNYNYTLKTGKWTKRYLQFWSKYGTGIETLQKYGYKPLRSLNAFNRYNKPYLIESRLNELIFVFERDGWGKWYMPAIRGVQDKRFGYFGNKPNDYVFGLEQLPKSGDECSLTGGEKDVTNLHSHNKWAVCLTSEESTPHNYPKFMELINSGRFKKYSLLLDNDSTGRRQMVKINKEYPQLEIKGYNIPENWDVSEYLENKYNKLMF